MVTGSMRNRLRPQGIEALRGAYDDGSEAWRGSVGVPTPGVPQNRPGYPYPGILGKGLQAIENKGRRAKRGGKEAAVD